MTIQLTPQQHEVAIIALNTYIQILVEYQLAYTGPEKLAMRERWAMREKIARELFNQLNQYDDENQTM